MTKSERMQTVSPGRMTTAAAARDRSQQTADWHSGASDHRDQRGSGFPEFPIQIWQEKRIQASYTHLLLTSGSRLPGPVQPDNAPFTGHPAGNDRWSGGFPVCRRYVWPEPEKQPEPLLPTGHRPAQPPERRGPAKPALFARPKSRRTDTGGRGNRLPGQHGPDQRILFRHSQQITVQDSAWQIRGCGSTRKRCPLRSSSQSLWPSSGRSEWTHWRHPGWL